MSGQPSEVQGAAYSIFREPDGELAATDGPQSANHTGVMWERLVGMLVGEDVFPLAGSGIGDPPDAGSCFAFAQGIFGKSGEVRIQTGGEGAIGPRTVRVPLGGEIRRPLSRK